MIHTFHPEVATEYAEHVAFYKSLCMELGIRFHEAVKLIIANVCAMPDRYSTKFPPDIRRARVNGFPCNVIFREADGIIQVLAIAHHRRRPLYWLSRV